MLLRVLVRFSLLREMNSRWINVLESVEPRNFSRNTEINGAYFFLNSTFYMFYMGISPVFSRMDEFVHSVSVREKIAGVLEVIG